MYKIKQKPEDFLVKEKVEIELSEKGRFHIYQVEKKNLTTYQAIQKIAQENRIKEKSIGVSGLKDKKAITTQLISINKKINEIDTEELKIKYLGKSEKQLYPGALKGNQFEIILRNLEENEKPKEITQFINYFDEQRFSNKNIEIGREIIKKNFQKALELIKETENITLEETTDFLGDLLKLKANFIKLYVNAYQSYLWNESVKEYVKNFEHTTYETPYGSLFFPKEQIQQKTIIMPGFSKHSEENQKIMKEEKITPRDFIIRQIPQANQEGNERKVSQEIKLQIKGPFEDEENKNKVKYVLNFYLEKGSYATMAIKQIMN